MVRPGKRIGWIYCHVKGKVWRKRWSKVIGGTFSQFEDDEDDAELITMHRLAGKTVRQTEPIFSASRYEWTVSISDDDEPLVTVRLACDTRELSSLWVTALSAAATAGISGETASQDPVTVTQEVRQKSVPQDAITDVPTSVAPAIAATDLPSLQEHPAAGIEPRNGMESPRPSGMVAPTQSSKGPLRQTLGTTTVVGRDVADDMTRTFGTAEIEVRRRRTSQSEMAQRINEKISAAAELAIPSRSRRPSSDAVHTPPRSRNTSVDEHREVGKVAVSTGNHSDEDEDVSVVVGPMTAVSKSPQVGFVSVSDESERSSSSEHVDNSESSRPEPVLHKDDYGDGDGDGDGDGATHDEVDNNDNTNRIDSGNGNVPDPIATKVTDVRSWSTKSIKERAAALGMAMKGQTLFKFTKNGRGAPHSRYVTVTAQRELCWGGNCWNIRSVHEGLHGGAAMGHFPVETESIVECFFVKATLANASDERVVEFRAPTADSARQWVLAIETVLRHGYNQGYESSVLAATTNVGIDDLIAVL